MPDTYWFSHPFIQEEKPNVHSKHAGSDKALPLIEEPQSPWTWFTRVPSSGSKSVSHSPFLWATLCTDKCNPYQEASHVPSTVYFGSGPVSASIIKWGWWDDSSPERDQRKLHDLPRFLFFALHCLACLHFFFFFSLIEGANLTHILAPQESSGIALNSKPALLLLLLLCQQEHHHFPSDTINSFFIIPTQDGRCWPHLHAAPESLNPVF